MKKSLYLVMALLTFSLVACGTQDTPEIQTPEIENVKDDEIKMLVDMSYQLTKKKVK